MDTLKFINEEMGTISIPYQFGEWAGAVVYPYFVGELTEDPTETEDGHETATLLLTGWHRGQRTALEQARQAIKSRFDPIFGRRAETESGTIAVFYDGAFFVPSGEDSLHKIQINLKIHTWRGAI